MVCEKMFGVLRLKVKDCYKTKDGSVDRTYGIKIIVPEPSSILRLPAPSFEKESQKTGLFVRIQRKIKNKVERYVELKVTCMKVGELIWVWSEHYSMIDVFDTLKSNNTIYPANNDVIEIKHESDFRVGWEQNNNTKEDFQKQFKREIQPLDIATTSTKTKAIKQFTPPDITRQTNEATPSNMWKLVELNTKDDIPDADNVLYTNVQFPEPEWFAEKVAICPEEALFLLDLEYTKKYLNKVENKDFSSGLIGVASDWVSQGKGIIINCKCDRNQNSCHGQWLKNKIIEIAVKKLELSPQNCVITTGQMPYEKKEFDDFLAEKGIDVVYIPDENADILIVGREWEQSILEAQINLRFRKTLFVYSQEMFLSRLAGKDPYDNKDVLMKFAEGHPVFEYLNKNFVDWPTTHIVKSLVRLTIIDEGTWPKEGVLGNNGYNVGVTKGKTREERHSILTKVFKTELNNVISLEYMAEWGTPNSGMRLKKMADSIASFACNAQRNNADYQQAIDDWEEDLDWLEKTFYNGRFRFDWPNAFVR